MTTPILNIPEVFDGQVDQFTVYNAALRSLEAAGNDFLSVSLASGNLTLTTAQFTRYFLFVSTGNAVARMLTVPVAKRLFAVQNSGTAALSVARGSTSHSIAIGETIIFYSDATANGLFKLGSSGGAGGLTYWAEAKNSAGENALYPMVALNVTDAATDVDGAIVPKGNGAFCLATPNGLASGGNKRGRYAVDLQLARNSASDVANGDYSVTIGRGNRALSAEAVAIGRNGIASGANTTTIGYICETGNGTGALAGGSSAYSAGISSLSFGNSTRADADYCVSLGNQSTSRLIIGKLTFASGVFSALGDAQCGQQVLRISTANATPAVLSSNGSAAATSNQLTLANNSSVIVTGNVVARQNATGDTATWTFVAAIKRGANAAATAMVAACTPVSVAADAGAAAWAISITADTTLGGLKVQVTGEAAKTIRWVCMLDSVEVVG